MTFKKKESKFEIWERTQLTAVYLTNAVVLFGQKLTGI
jgi:hypothetical protein